MRVLSNPNTDFRNPNACSVKTSMRNLSKNLLTFKPPHTGFKNVSFEIFKYGFLKYTYAGFEKTNTGLKENHIRDL